MGQSSSTGRRRRRYRTDSTETTSSTITTNNYSSSSFPHQPPPPSLPSPPPPSSTSSNYPYYTPYPYNHPPTNPNYYYSSSNSYTPPPYQQQLTHAVDSIVTFVESLIKPTTSSGTGSRPNAYLYYDNYGPPPNRLNGPSVPTPPLPGRSPPPPSSLQQQQPPPEFVESQNAKTVKNEVNIHKDTIRFTFDEKNDHHLLSFTFDASADGSITIYYFAKEEESCIFSPAYPDIYRPTKFPFQEGPGQTFYQPSGSGINLVFFAQEDLSKPLDGNIFPLVVCLNNKEATCAQITEAIIEKTNNGSFQAKVIKQILLVNGERYELQEIYGLENSERKAESNDDSEGDERGEECVICLSEPRNTAVFPCRHMCMCSDCARALRTQSNKCPICRQPVEKLMEINVNKG